VAEDFAFVDEVAGDGFNAERADAVKVGFDGELAFTGILREGFGLDGCGVDEGVVEYPRAGVVENFFDVLGGGEAEGLVGLGHEVADVDAGGGTGGEGFGDAAYEEIGDQRGVERAGAEGDEIGVGDGFESFGKRLGIGGREHEFGDGFFRGCDAGFAVDDGAIVHAGGESGVGGGGGVDAAAGGEDLRRSLDGGGEVPGDSSERGEEEIAEAVTFEIARAEAVLEELGEKMLVLGEGDEAVAEVAGRRQMQVFAETARRATVVGDGDDGGEVADEAGEVFVLRVGLRSLGRGDVAFEAAQEGGEAGAAADGDDVELVGGSHRGLV